MNEREHWLDDPQHIKLLWRGFIAVLVMTVAAGALVDLHPHFAIEALFGFNAAYGFITCLLMIVGAKALGLLLKRPDNFYQKEQADD